MLPSLSQFNSLETSNAYKQALPSISLIRQLDGTPGDKNPNPNAVSLQTPSGQLDAVVLNNPDKSQTVVQRLSKLSGEKITTLLDVPATEGEMSGFEIDEPVKGLFQSGQPTGTELKLQKNNYVTLPSYDGGTFTVPSADKYATQVLPGAEAVNDLFRAQSVLAAFDPPSFSIST